MTQLRLRSAHLRFFPCLLLFIVLTRGLATAVEPCAEISRLYTTGNNAAYPALLALQCLRTSPLDIEGGQLQVKVIRPRLIVTVQTRQMSA